MGIKIHQLRPDGQVSHHKGHEDPDFPGAIVCEETDQHFISVDNPFFSDQLVLYPERRKDGTILRRPFLTIEELANFNSPLIRRTNEKTLMVTFYDDFLPITARIRNTKEEIEIRNNATISGVQDGLNRGRTKADKATQGMQTIMIMTIAAIAGFLTIIVGILFIIGKVGQ